MQLWRRQIAIFGLAFSLVIAGGVALAAVGTMSGPPDDGAASIDAASAELEGDHDETTTTTTIAEKEHEEDGEKGDDTSDGEGDHEETTTTTTIAEEKDGDDGEKSGDEGEEIKDEEDTTPPGFEILSPADGTHFKEKVVTFSGYVEPGATVTRGKYTANVEGDHWSIALVLSPGKNIVGFVATDAAGNKADDSVTLYYDAPTDKEDGGDGGGEDKVEWSAHQKYGSCGESPPYDVFYGTAPAGTKVFVGSPYGSGSTTAGASGHWEIKVKFYEVPPGKSFEVVIESSNGNRKVFGFTYTGGEGEGGGEGDK